MKLHLCLLSRKITARKWLHKWLLMGLDGERLVSKYIWKVPARGISQKCLHNFIKRNVTIGLC
jgi:hypothetical protein